ncbi:MAG: alpha/beta hydrolase [Vulcanimicrobiaceae bacterium]
MNLRFTFPFVFGIIASLAWALPACAEQPWQRPIPHPTLPPPAKSASVPINGVKLWYAEFGTGQPVILLHGGLIDSNAWGLQVPALASHYRVIVLDNRGHGRSTRTSEPFTYNAMASDVLALMDYLRIPKAAIVGWSDGANIGLNLAIHHPDRLAKLFAFAGNSDPAGLKPFEPTPVAAQFLKQAEGEYRDVSPTPDQFQTVMHDDSQMARTQPRFTAEQLRTIRVPTWIVAGDRDQFIKRENTDYMAAQIPEASELILPGVSHGAPWQDPDLFNAALLHFLNQ